MQAGEGGNWFSGIFCCVTFLLLYVFIYMKLTVCKFSLWSVLSYNREHVPLLLVPSFSIKL